ncbi:MAG: 3-hydroxyacyl-CoA dehydrogenase NAD-binding domain-containing protein [Planctomycetota bacterium]
MSDPRYTNFVLQWTDDDVLRVILDVPGKPMNILNQSVMTELDIIVRRLESDPGQCAVVTFESGKESGFLAGADVSVINDIDSPEVAEDLLVAGQRLFARIEALPIFTVAVIHGPCMGGGTELALACDYRIARDNSSTQLGLPEIKLGLIPGWGGTQRLPRLVGTPLAMKMILTGKALSASEADRAGLVDRAASPDHWDREVEEFLSAVSCGLSQRKQRRRNWTERLLDNGLGRSFVFRAARTKIRSKIDHFPALEAAIDAIEAGFDPKADGEKRERIEFTRLLETPTCRSLLRLFFAREAARKPATWSDVPSEAVHDHPIQRVGVVGGGAMGAGIAVLAAARGFDSLIKEIEAGVSPARARVGSLVEQRARHKKLSATKRDDLASRVTISDDASSLAECDLIVEAVVERMDVKRSVFQDCDQGRRPHTILASNTSSLSVSEMATATKCQSHVAGLHFFNPVHRMELVEVFRGKETNEATVAKLIAFVRALGKTPIVTSDSPGFLVNRVLFPYLGEAIRMAGEVFGIERIDQEVRRFGMPMGPLELLDQVGLDVAHHVAATLDGTLPEAQPVVAQLERMVSEGHLGVKSGLGFYVHSGKKRVAAFSEIDPPANEDSHGFVRDGLTPIQRRLVYPMLIEAMRCLEEQVVEFPWAVDLGMALGTGFAPHHGGPIALIETIGHVKVLANLRALEELHGSRFAPPQRLIQTVGRVDRSLSRNKE